MLVISLTKNKITGMHIDTASKSVINATSQPIQDNNRSSAINDFVTRHRQNDEAIRIVAKGNPHERCGLDIDANIRVINRFHAYALGMFELYGKKISSSYAYINMSSGIGCGVIKDCKIIAKYGPRGVGGLAQTKRLSDGMSMSIASIAGIKALQDGQRQSQYDSLDDYIASKHDVVRDIADAISELIINEIPRSIQNIGVNIYGNRIFTATKSIIIEAINQSYTHKINRYANIHLYNQTDYSEEEIKCIGAALF